MNNSRLREGGWTDLLGEDGDVLAEGVGGADVGTRRAALPRRAGGQLTFLKNQCQQWEQGMSEEEEEEEGEGEEEEDQPSAAPPSSICWIQTQSESNLSILTDEERQRSKVLAATAMLWLAGKKTAGQRPGGRISKTKSFHE